MGGPRRALPTAGEREGYGGREAADQGPERDGGGGAIRIRTRRGADAQTSEDTEVRLLSSSTAEAMHRGRIWISTHVRSIACAAAGACDHRSKGAVLHLSWSMSKNTAGPC